MFYYYVLCVLYCIYNLSEFTEKRRNTPLAHNVVYTSITVCHALVVGCVEVRLNVPVNNFSVMSGRNHRFLGN